MSSMKKKPKQLLNTVSVTLGCSCRKPKLSSIFTPKPKSKLPKYQPDHRQHPLSFYPSSSSTSSSTNTTSSLSSFMDYSSSSSEQPFMAHQQDQNYPYPSYEAAGYSKTVAVEKESEDPYVDFRQSMLQMIMENGIYSKDELKELLNCFLQLNSPSLHGIIIRVFTEIWNSFFFNAGTATSRIRRNGNGTQGDGGYHRHNNNNYYYHSKQRSVYVKPK